jgi:hypothetical protein
MEKNDAANMSLICTQNILKKKKKKEGEMTSPERLVKTVSLLSSLTCIWHWAPTRKSYMTAIPTCSDSVSHPQTLYSSLSTSSEIDSHQTYIKKKKKRKKIYQISSHLCK